MTVYLANAAIILGHRSKLKWPTQKKPGQDFVPMINLLLPTTLQPTFRTDPIYLASLDGSVIDKANLLILKDL